MRRLEIDWSRAEEIFRRAEDSFASVRAAGDRVRAAKRRNENAKRDLELAEVPGYDFVMRGRGNDEPFIPGQDNINLCAREAKDAEAVLAAANARYTYAIRENGYFASLRGAIRAHIETLPRSVVPAQLRQDD